MTMLIFSSICICIGLLLGALHTLTLFDKEESVKEKVKNKRKVKIGLITMNGILYRIFTLVVQFFFFLILTGKWEWSLGISAVWNLVNLGLYYIWHYLFARYFKVGK